LVTAQDQGDPTKFRFFVSALGFSDGTTVDLKPNSVVVVVGPNNAGKSRALRDILSHLGDPSHQGATPVVTRLEDTRSGTGHDFFGWLCTRASFREAGTRKDDLFGGVGFNLSGKSLSQHAQTAWVNDSLGNYARAVSVLLTTEKRLRAADPCSSYDATTASPSEPIQALYADRALELQLSGTFRSAYRRDLAVDRLGGSKIPLHVGDAPDPSEFGGELAIDYQRAVKAMPLLHEQGDGMRSFASCLLYSGVVDYPIVLIDEPETFLHPAPARVLARHLAQSTLDKQRQLFVTTHNGDILRGLLSTEQRSITIVRLTRSININHASSVSLRSVEELWADPLLRVSNILEGLFHEHVCLCEADTDVRFYSATVAAMCEQRGAVAPDVLYTHCSGKHRMPSVVRALHSIGVRTTVIADIDMLDGIEPLKKLWAAFGRDWVEIQADWSTVDAAVRQTQKSPAIAVVREEIRKVLDAAEGASLTPEITKRVRQLTKAVGGWQHVKASGEAAIPKGGVRSAYERLRATLLDGGIALVPVGELEGFLPTVSKKGPAWVNKAIEYDLAKAPALEAARTFLRNLPFFPADPEDAAQQGAGADLALPPSGRSVPGS
jgi:AAA domain, putative AbiEii toxin, Type IV TA system